jgi:hypothetical protein
MITEPLNSNDINLTFIPTTKADLLNEIENIFKRYFPTVPKQPEPQSNFITMTSIEVFFNELLTINIQIKRNKGIPYYDISEYSQITDGFHKYTNLLTNLCNNAINEICTQKSEIENIKFRLLSIENILKTTWDCYLNTPERFTYKRLNEWFVIKINNPIPDLNDLNEAFYFDFHDMLLVKEDSLLRFKEQINIPQPEPKEVNRNKGSIRGKNYK